MSSAVSEVDAQSSSPARDAAPVAAITDLHVAFRRNGRDVQALRGVSLDIAPGEILGLGRRIGVRQERPRVHHARSAVAGPGAGLGESGGHRHGDRRRENAAQGAPPRSRRHFPGPDDVPEPDHADRQAGGRGRGQRRRGAQAAHRGRHPGTQAPVPGIPARAVRWAAATGDDRHRDRRQPGVDHRRRTDHGSRRHRAGPGPSAASAAAHRNRLQHHADHPRPRGGRADFGSHRGALRRPHRRDRSDRRGSRPSRPSLHPWTAALPADSGHRQAPQARRTCRGGPQPGGPPAGLCVRATLCAGHNGV